MQGYVCPWKEPFYAEDRVWQPLFLFLLLAMLTAPPGKQIAALTLHPYEIIERAAWSCYLLNGTPNHSLTQD